MGLQRAGHDWVTFTLTFQFQTELSQKEEDWVHSRACLVPHSEPYCPQVSGRTHLVVEAFSDVQEGNVMVKDWSVSVRIEGAEDEENRCLCKYSRVSQTQYSEGCFPKVSGRTVSVCIYFHMIRMGVWEAGERCTACKIYLNKIKALC